MTRCQSRKNDSSTLRRSSRHVSPMAAYDRLPSDLRLWLADAALPWSAQSVLPLWRKAMRACGGDPAAARHRLSRIERRKLSLDARRIWGATHPAAQPGEAG